jgi:mono/diheme cytochrome c family protein
MRKAWIAAGATVPLALAAWWVGAGSPETPPVLRPDDPAVVARGAEVYAAECAACHGAELEGQPDWRERGSDGLLPAPPHDETGHTWHHPSAMLVELTARGPAAMIGDGYESAMPGYAGILSEEDITAVLSYIKAQWPPEIRAAHDEIDARHARETR